MNNTQLSVSVVLCTFNGATFLGAQLDSILQQTYPLHELLVFDDGSTDSTLAMLDDYASRFPIIRIHSNRERLGFNKNFQQALRAASGDAIAISDQDDIWVHEKVAKMMAAWSPGCPVIYCDSMRFSGPVPDKPERSHKIPLFEGKDARKLLFTNTVSGHAMMIRRSFLPHVLPFPEGIFYDWWTAYIAADNGGVCLLDEPLVLHRLHEKNASGHKEETLRDVIVYQRKDMVRHMAEFQNAPHVKTEIRELAAAFHARLSDRDTTSKKRALFMLILKYLDVFFYYRRRKPVLNWLNRAKYAYYFAYYD
jgi:glycosyltransferase involved in cell wall biosynthesis